MKSIHLTFGLALLAMLAFFSSCSTGNNAGEVVIPLAKYGIRPDTGEDMSTRLRKVIEEIRAEYDTTKTLVFCLDSGRYDFFPDSADRKTYYISNHDQPNPKRVGIALENLRHIVLDGQGSELVFHGEMLPLSLVGSEDCGLRNFHIDFEQPHIGQARVVSNDTSRHEIVLEMEPWVDYSIEKEHLFIDGEGWRKMPRSCIAFEPGTRRLVYRTSDVGVPLRGVKADEGRRIRYTEWNNPRLVPGTVLALRDVDRPTPGIFLSHNVNTALKNIQVHYAEGMGLLAQLCENIRLDGFSVCLRGNDDPRYFTTQADATHFSQCRGVIDSRGGLYENMMDDAINVHGTYLKLQERIGDSTLVAAYMHDQSYGFDWGFAGDTVHFLASRTMDLLDGENVIRQIVPDGQASVDGAKRFRITFEQPLDEAIRPENSIGLENMTRTPSVVFANNVVRHNRARGSLFSTPRKTLVHDNVFDHTSGTAILLCGDCNGWYETGACRDVEIRGNKFVNALTNMFQFTNAVISIYPEIPDLEHQQTYFHSGIVIEGNEFETFDQPILYAKSVDGLVFRNNTIHTNRDYPAFHWNKQRFLLERVINSTIE